VALVKQDIGARALLFDMLVDDNPNQPNESSPFRYFKVDQLKESVINEVTNLLNTRRSFANFDNIVWGTTLAYGMGDHAGASTNSEKDKEAIATDIQKTIQRFESSLKSIRVKIVEAEPLSAGLLVVIDAILKAGKIQEQFSFEVVIGPESQGE
jgi:type VI secretion system lysozyme-like protein